MAKKEITENETVKNLIGDLTIGQIVIIDEFPAIIVKINEDGTINAQQFQDAHSIKYISNYEIGG